MQFHKNIAYYINTMYWLYSLNKLDYYNNSLTMNKVCMNKTKKI